MGGSLCLPLWSLCCWFVGVTLCRWQDIPSVVFVLCLSVLYWGDLVSYTHVHAHTHACAHTHAQTHTQSCTQSRTESHTRTQSHTQWHTYTHSRTHTHSHTHAHTHSRTIIDFGLDLTTTLQTKAAKTEQSSKWGNERHTGNHGGQPQWDRHGSCCISHWWKGGRKWTRAYQTSLQQKTPTTLPWRTQKASENPNNPLHWVHKMTEDPNITLHGVHKMQQKNPNNPLPILCVCVCVCVCDHVLSVWYACLFPRSLCK